MSSQNSRRIAHDIGKALWNTDLYPPLSIDRNISSISCMNESESLDFDSPWSSEARSGELMLVSRFVTLVLRIEENR